MSGKTIRAPVLVGLVIIVGVAGLLYMVSKVKTTVLPGTGTYVVYATFEDVTGLVVQSTVTMVGTPVGVIEDIRRVDTDQGVRAQVAIRLAPDVVLYSGEVRDGRLVGAASVLRRQSSVLGDFFLSISPGLNGKALEDGDEIPVVIGSSGIEAVLDQMGKLSNLYPKIERIVDHVEAISGSLAGAVGGPEGGQAMSDLVHNLRDISAQVKEIGDGARTVAGEIQRIVDEGTVDRVAANIEGTTEDAREIADRVKKIVSAANVESLVQNLTETSRNLNEVGVQLSQVVEKGITPRLSQLNRIFHNFERFSVVLADFSEGESPTVAETLSNLRDFSTELLSLVKGSKGDLADTIQSVQGTLEKAQDSMTKLDDTLDNMRAITADLRQGKGTIGRLLTDDRLVEEVEEVITDTKEFVKSYTLMQTEVQLQTSYFPETRFAKNIFSIRFRPKLDKYYLLQIVDDPRGFTTEKLVITDTNDPTKGTPVLKENVTTTTHNLKISFQFAKSYYFLTGRFGIMESTGGIGLDFNFFQDRLAFQFDLFDFTLDNNPRLRSQVEWEVFRHFFVAGGLDDMLNEGYYGDYYLAAGIRFTDEDLKALLLASPPMN